MFWPLQRKNSAGLDDMSLLLWESVRKQGTALAGGEPGWGWGSQLLPGDQSPPFENHMSAQRASLA